MRRHALPLVLLALAPSTPAGATRLLDWHDAARDRDVPAKLYLPEPVKEQTPVVVFSPGLGGTRNLYARWAEAWAGHGYAVLVLQHVGSDLAHLNAAAMNATEYAARVADVKFALDELTKLSGTDYAGKLDCRRVAMAGHSYGAVTTQAVVGQRPGGVLAASPEPRVVCGIVMSPSPPRADGRAAAEAAFAEVKLPLLHLTGTADDAPVGGVVAADRRVPFDACPASPQWLITFKDADHAVFGGRPAWRKANGAAYAKAQPLIEQVTTTFLDAELRGDAKATAWLKEQLKTTVGDAGVVEAK